MYRTMRAGCSGNNSGLKPFQQLCQKAGLPIPEPEYRFHPTRKYRFDWAFVKEKIALEIEGGIWTGGRHTSGSGFSRDLTKYRFAVKGGWKLLRYSPKEFSSGAAIVDVLEMLE
jgi:hypothetical protein